MKISTFFKYLVYSRFDSSSTALTINDFMRENNAEESGICL